ncbi:MAG: histidine phosphatase family protein [Thermoplasmataceae archaeon]
MKTFIFFLRHAVTDSNKLGIWQCSIDEDLSQEGVNQASAVVPVIASLSPDIIISSPMRRTVQTAEIIMKTVHPENFKTCEGLRERSGGVIEGLTSVEIKQKFGIEMATILSDSIDVLPGVEPLQAFLERINTTVDSVYRKYQGKRILVVTHGGFIRGFYQSNIGNADGVVRFRNCSILGVARENGIWSVIYSMGTDPGTA